MTPAGKSMTAKALWTIKENIRSLQILSKNLGSAPIRRAKTYFPAHKAQLEKLAVEWETATAKIKKECLTPALTKSKALNTILPKLQDEKIKYAIIRDTALEIYKLQEKAASISRPIDKKQRALEDRLFENKPGKKVRLFNQLK